jgi:hypothetical protein
MHGNTTINKNKDHLNLTSAAELSTVAAIGRFVQFPERSVKFVDKPVGNSPDEVVSIVKSNRVASIGIGTSLKTAMY